MAGGGGLSGSAVIADTGRERDGSRGGADESGGIGVAAGSAARGGAPAIGGGTTAPSGDGCSSTAPRTLPPCEAITLVVVGGGVGGAEAGAARGTVGTTGCPT
jgi:hypothetical protein